jgi:hypothetical protein
MHAQSGSLGAIPTAYLMASHWRSSWWHCRTHHPLRCQAGALWCRLRAFSALQLAATLLIASPSPPSLLCMSLDGYPAVDDDHTTAPRWPPALPQVEEGGCRFSRLKGAPDPALGLPAERHIHRFSPLCCYIWADRSSSLQPRHPSSPPRLPPPPSQRQQQRTTNEVPQRSTPLQRLLRAR